MSPPEPGIPGPDGGGREVGGSDFPSPRARDTGRPVGRRLFLGLLGVGALATIAGGAVVRALKDSPVAGVLPSTGRFRIYSVTPIPRVELDDWTLTVDGDVERPGVFGYTDLEELGFVTEEQDFHCVTGWSVYGVRWTGLPLARLLDAVGAPAVGKNVTFGSFDGAYTESLTVEQARAPGNLVAVRIGDEPLPVEQGFPARMIVPAMYGYKGTKWLSRVTVEDELRPGYWVVRGYDQDGTVGASNGFGA